MSASISPITSILALQVGRPFCFSPALLGASSATFTAPGLPPGMTLNTVTGRISGVPIRAGIYPVTITAFPGGSPPATLLNVVMAVEDSLITPDSSVELTVDVATKVVSALGGGSSPDVLVSAKTNDVFMLSVRFVRSGKPVLVSLSALGLWLKEVADGPVLVGASTWYQVTNGTDVRYLIPVSVSSADLLGALSNHEDLGGTKFSAMAEIEWVESRQWYPSGPVTSLRQTSQTFGVSVERALSLLA